MTPLFFSDKAHYIFQAVLISKTCITGAVPTQGRSIRGPFIVIRLQCGAQYWESGLLLLTFLLKTIARLPWILSSMLQWSKSFFASALEELNARLVWFQEDGAMAHTARRLIAVLREMLPGRLISERRHFVARALTRFNPLQLFLVGVSKGRSV